jgi:DNA-binding MarR family transcriptional regulator
VSHDRRVRHVVLTAKGRKTHAELMEEFHTPPSELVDMDRDDLEALQRALVKLAPRYRTNQSAASRETSARVPRSSKR